jgi:hypothetical protein
MQRNTKPMDGIVRFHDIPIERAIPVKASLIEPLATSLQEPQHWPDSLAKRFGLADRKLSFHGQPPG